MLKKVLFLDRLTSFIEVVAFYAVELLKLSLSFCVLFLFGSFAFADVVLFFLVSVLTAVFMKIFSRVQAERVFASDVWFYFQLVFLICYLSRDGFSSVKVFILAAFCCLFVLTFVKRSLKNSLLVFAKEKESYLVPLHELAHFVVNERLSIYESSFVCLVPGEGYGGFLNLGRRKLKDSSYPFALMCLLLSGYVACESFLFGKRKLSASDLSLMLEKELVTACRRPLFRKKIMARFLSEGVADEVYKKTFSILSEEKEKLFSLCDCVRGQDKIECDWLREQYYKL